MGRTRSRGMDQNGAQEAVSELLNASGGTLSHNDLVGQLSTSGKADAASFLFALQQSKAIYARVQAQPEGKPVLEYSLTPFPTEGGE